MAAKKKSLELPLPSNWIKKESSSKPGRFYFFNTETRKSTWRHPLYEKYKKREKKTEPTTPDSEFEDTLKSPSKDNEPSSTCNKREREDGEIMSEDESKDEKEEKREKPKKKKKKKSSHNQEPTDIPKSYRHEGHSTDKSSRKTHTSRQEASDDSETPRMTRSSKVDSRSYLKHTKKPRQRSEDNTRAKAMEKSLKESCLAETDRQIRKKNKDLPSDKIPCQLASKESTLPTSTVTSITIKQPKSKASHRKRKPDKEDIFDNRTGTEISVKIESDATLNQKIDLGKKKSKTETFIPRAVLTGKRTIKTEPPVAKSKNVQTLDQSVIVVDKKTILDDSVVILNTSQDTIDLCSSPVPFESKLQKEKHKFLNKLCDTTKSNQIKPILFENDQKSPASDDYLPAVKKRYTVKANTYQPPPPLPKSKATTYQTFKQQCQLKSNQIYNETNHVSFMPAKIQPKSQDFFKTTISKDKNESHDLLKTSLIDNNSQHSSCKKKTYHSNNIQATDMDTTDNSICKLTPSLSSTTTNFPLQTSCSQIYHSVEASPNFGLCAPNESPQIDIRTTTPSHNFHHHHQTNNLNQSVILCDNTPTPAATQNFNFPPVNSAGNNSVIFLENTPVQTFQAGTAVNDLDRSVIIGDIQAVEDMEVEELDDIVFENLQAVRTNNEFSVEPIGELTILVASTPSPAPPPRRPIEVITVEASPVKVTGGSLTLVVDTCVLIAHLAVLQDLLLVTLPKWGTPTLVLPWTVVQELDYIKDNRKHGRYDTVTVNRAIQAVHFINTELRAGNSHLVGQSPLDAKKSKIEVRCNDDRILACCLQWKEQQNEGDELLLLSKDVNLCNKAMIMRVNAVTTDTLWDHLGMKKPNLKALRKKNTVDLTPKARDVLSIIAGGSKNKTYKDNSNLKKNLLPALTQARTNENVKEQEKVMNKGPAKKSAGKPQPSRPEPLTKAQESDVLAKFNAIWQTLYDVRSQLQSAFSQGSNSENFQQAVHVLQQVGRLMLTLHNSFESCMELSPLILHNRGKDFNNLCHCLNNFLPDSNVSFVDDSPPLTTLMLTLYFENTTKRPLLMSGLVQLKDFIKCFEQMYNALGNIIH